MMINRSVIYNTDWIWWYVIWWYAWYSKLLYVNVS